MIKKTYCLLFCIFVFGCSKPTSVPPRSSEDEIMREASIQQQIVNDIKNRGGKAKPWKNPPNMRTQFERVGERVEKAGAEVCVAMHLQERGCYYYFKLSTHDEINANADGKNITIFTGMMRFVENDDELAVVMAHELAHNLMGHPQAERTNANLGMIAGIALEALAASQGVSTGGGISQLGEDIGARSYSIDFEKEADYVGMYILARSGYNLLSAPLMWRRMSIENPDGIYNATTHPSNPERYMDLQKTISEINYKQQRKLPLIPEMQRD